MTNINAVDDLVWLINNYLLVVNSVFTDSLNAWHLLDDVLYSLDVLWNVFVDSLHNWDNGCVFLFAWNRNSDWNLHRDSDWAVVRDVLLDKNWAFLVNGVRDILLFVDWGWDWVIIVEALLHGNWSFLIASMDIMTTT